MDISKACTAEGRRAEGARLTDVDAQFVATLLATPLSHVAQSTPLCIYLFDVMDF
jgi:hypothetical protein